MFHNFLLFALIIIHESVYRCFLFTIVMSVFDLFFMEHLISKDFLQTTSIYNTKIYNLKGKFWIVRLQLFDDLSMKLNKNSYSISAAVVIAFFVCWAPFHTQRLMYIAYYDYGWKFVNEATYHHVRYLKVVILLDRFQFWLKKLYLRMITV